MRRVLATAFVLAAVPFVGGPGGETPGRVVEWPIPEFAEPSGIVYHPGRRTLFIVGDEGDIGEVSLDGKLLRQTRFGGDLEAVTVDPRNGLLYVVREGHEIIFEIRPDDFKLLRRFTINRSFNGDPDFLRRGGDGVEGLTFVPDDSDPEGGRLWVVNQWDPPVLVELSIPMRTSKEKHLVARIARAIPVENSPLSEVTWDAANREFLVASALWKSIAVLDEEGRFQRSVRIPAFMPEGLSLLPDGRVAIAQDSGGLVVWAPDADPFRAQPAAAAGRPGDGAPASPLPTTAQATTPGSPAAAEGRP